MAILDQNDKSEVASSVYIFAPSIKPGIDPHCPLYMHLLDNTSTMLVIISFTVLFIAPREGVFLCILGEE